VTAIGRDDARALIGMFVLTAVCVGMAKPRADGTRGRARRRSREFMAPLLPLQRARRFYHKTPCAPSGQNGSGPLPKRHVTNPQRMIDRTSVSKQHRSPERWLALVPKRVAESGSDGAGVTPFSTFGRGRPRAPILHQAQIAVRRTCRHRGYA